MEHYNINDINDVKKLQEYINVNNYKTPTITLKNSCYTIQFNKDEDFTIPMTSFSKEERQDIYNWIKNLKDPKERTELDEFIFGKDATTHIVGCEVDNETIELFIEKDGKITSKFIENKYWIVSCRKFDDSWKPLEGNLYYRFIKFYSNSKDFYQDKKRYRDFTFSVSNPREAAMLLNGFTFFKGMKVSDVSILCTDIESTTLMHNKNSRVLMISNTFRKNNVVTRKIFSCDEYETDAEMIDDWCSWVRETNPTIFSGFNIFGFDLPYLNYCAQQAGTSLKLGRDGSEIKFDKYTSRFRKDGSQDYEYTRCHIYGREIVDMYFVAYHYDIGRKYERYKLKEIIKHEGLAKPNRVYYEAENIAEDWKDLEKRKLIKLYGQDDSDETLALFDLMIPAYFYLTPSIPKTFEQINYSASGSQLNSFLIRSYLQINHSLPKASEVVKFPGAISDGNPGIYSNVFKVDVASLYPSIMLQYEIYDKVKDPKKFFSKMVSYFTEERLKNKKLAKETGDRYYKDLEQAQKIVINSAYGLLGATGLLFNSPTNAELVTRYGREILKKSIYWATGQEYKEKVIEDKEEDEDE
jgi:DNA polymerase I